MLVPMLDKQLANKTFTFTLCSRPSLRLCFDRSTSELARPNAAFKRRRALSDVDGSGDGERKKRRLRMHLITSRLSRPYSQPATNIVSRGVSKIAVWGKHRAVGRSVLRKAAIMNRVRLRIDAAKDLIRQQQERKRETLVLSEFVVQMGRPHDTPLPPSPLGLSSLSNYDALDREDEYDDDSEEQSAIYSDWTIMNPATGDSDDSKYLDAIDGLSTYDLPDTPPPPPEESIVDMLREGAKEGASYFVRVGG